MNLTAILPEIILAATSLLVLMALALRRQHEIAVALTAVGLVAAFVSLQIIDDGLPYRIESLLVVDSFALFLAGLFIAASLAITFLGHHYLSIRHEHREEFYAVLLIATLGAVVLVAADHFISLFLGLEVLSVSLYVMIAYLRNNLKSLEAGLKYIILAGASSAFLLFGMALIYASEGTMNFTELGEPVPMSGSQSLFIRAGLALIIVGIGFKLAVVPFHMWTPDVYEGAPAPVTAFIATVSKGAVVGVLVRLFFSIDGFQYRTAFLSIALVAVASMLIGNLLALLQRNVKRILAYSSITHLGYILVAFLAAGERGIEAVLLYLVIYFVTILGAFGLVGLLSGPDEERTALEDYRGLFWQRPWPAAAFTATLLSLAGIPLTAGFVGKFFVLSAGVGAALWILVVALAIGSAIGIFYYTRVIAAMFSQPDAAAPTQSIMSLGGSLVLTLLTLALFVFGIYPGPLLTLIRRMVSGLP